MRRFLPFLTGVLLLGSVAAAPAHAAPQAPPGTTQHQNGAAHLVWDFTPQPMRAWNVDQTVEIGKKAKSTFWALQFGFAEVPDGGYLGIQTDGYRADGSVGETAIFSIWGADQARGGQCLPFGGEGEGQSCRAAFPIQKNTPYRLRVWQLDTDATGQWWGAWVRDGRTGVDQHLGDIHVTGASRSINGALNFSEYFGPQVPCNRVPQSKAYFVRPAGNSRSGEYDYYAHFQSFSTLSCVNASTRATTLGGVPAQLLTLGGR